MRAMVRKLRVKGARVAKGKDEIHESPPRYKKRMPPFGGGRGVSRGRR